MRLVAEKKMTPRVIQSSQKNSSINFIDNNSQSIKQAKMIRAIQLTVDGEGKTPQSLLDKYNKKPQKKKEFITEFITEVYESEIDFSKEELNGFLVDEIDGFTTDVDIFLEFKKYVAEQRSLKDDSEGHAIVRHLEKGDQFIVDRINKANADKCTMSYLFVDKYLEWDNFLRLNSELLWDEYMILVNEFNGQLVTLNLSNVITESSMLRLKEITYRPSFISINGKILEMSICQCKPEITGTSVSIPISASVKLLSKEKKGRKVYKEHRNEKKFIDDVIDDDRELEAHTGSSLAPKFLFFDRKIDVDNIDESQLDWVTKF